MILKTNLSIRKRIALTGILVFLLLLACIFCFAPKAKAAGNKKTMYLPVQIKEVESRSGGEKSTILCKMSYNKKGLIQTSSVTYGYGGDDPGTSKTTYKHYKNGALKSYIENYNGEPSESKAFTLNKKGQIATVKRYNYPEGKKSLFSTTTYKYNKKGVLKKTVEKGSGFTETTTYYGNGNPKQKKRTEKTTDSSGITTDSSILKYDSHGNLESYLNTIDAPGTEYDITIKEAVTNTYNKKGDLKKAVSNMTDTFYEEGTKIITKTKSVETLKYTYTKSGYVSKCVSKNKLTTGGETTMITTTTTFKKFSVPKKLVPYAGEQD